MATLTWLGHSGFLIESNGKKVAVDPWKKGPTFSGTDLTDVDTVVVTHGHFDHAEDAPEICKDSGATLVCIHEVTFWAMQNGVAEDKVVGMNVGGTFEKDGFAFSMVDAVHSGGCPGPKDDIVPGGAAAGFVITCPDGDVVYHAGDTAAFLDMQLIGQMHDIDIALLPIGGHYTMDPRGAAKAIELLGVKEVVPMHYATFPILTGTPDQLREHAAKDVTIHHIEPGDTIEVGQTVVA